MIFELNDELAFPHPKYANENGLLAIGGDLKVERLLLAYENGIFPWYSDDDPILWYAPQPRCVLFPEKIKVSKSMKRLIKKNNFSITFNKDFNQVIENCKTVFRADQDGTWLNDNMKNAYIKLHNLGLASSVEVWNEKFELVGGLYGVSFNKCFFGESMFHKVSNASKLALIQLCISGNYKIIDCQMHTSHLESLGAEIIPFQDYINIIQQEY